MSQSKHSKRKKQLLCRPTGGKKLAFEEWEESRVARGNQWGIDLAGLERWAGLDRNDFGAQMKSGGVF